MPVELAFRPFETATLKAWDKGYPLLVHVSISIRFAWLLKQVIGHPIGNPAWPDERFSKEFALKIHWLLDSSSLNEKSFGK